MFSLLIYAKYLHDEIQTVWLVCPTAAARKWKFVLIFSLNMEICALLRPLSRFFLMGGGDDCGVSKYVWRFHCKGLSGPDRGQAEGAADHAR